MGYKYRARETKTLASWGSCPSSDTSQSISKEFGSVIKHKRAVTKQRWTLSNLQVAFLLKIPLRGKSQAKMGQRWSETVSAKVWRTARDPKEPGLSHHGDKQANAGLRGQEARNGRAKEECFGLGSGRCGLALSGLEAAECTGGSAPNGGRHDSRGSLVLLSAPAGGNSKPAASRQKPGERWLGGSGTHPGVGEQGEAGSGEVGVGRSGRADAPRSSGSRI